MRRHLIWAAVVELVAAAVASGQPPAFVVENRTAPRFVVTDKTAKACVCGDSCKCVKGTCPTKCPVAVAATHKPPEGYPPAPAGFHWALYPGGVWGLVQDGVTVPNTYRTVAEQSPNAFGVAQPGCVGGTCGTAVPVFGGVFGTPAFGSCPNGNCPRR